MTNYAAIDRVLMPWAQKHELHVYARERERPLRSIILYYWAGNRHESAGHLWLEGPDANGDVTVHGAQPEWYQKRTVPLDRLETTLEETYRTMVARPAFD